MKKSIMCFLAALCITGACVCGYACGTNPQGQTPPPSQDPPSQDPPSEDPPSEDPPPEEHQHTFADPVVIEPDRGVQGCVLHACTGCTYSYRDGYMGALGAEMPTNKAYSFLFIGNSYTFENELWSVFRSVAQGEGYTSVTVDEVTQGGYTLESFSSPSDAKGAIVEQKLTANKYDFVFLQEQSLRPASDPVPFYTGVKRLHDRIGKTGARDVLYMTWGRHEDSTELAQNGFTYFELSQKLAAAYEAIGAKLNIPVSPVGAAFYNIHKEHPEIELYQADRSHPSMAGTYLAALCHYAVIFGKSPVGAAYMPRSIPREQAAILQAGAHEAVFGSSVVTDDYRIDPDGITL